MLLYDRTFINMCIFINFFLIYLIYKNIAKYSYIAFPYIMLRKKNNLCACVFSNLGKFIRVPDMIHTFYRYQSTNGYSYRCEMKLKHISSVNFSSGQRNFT